jgi:threonine synthase
MTKLSSCGCYQIDHETKEEIDKTFVGFCTNEKRTSETIKKYYEEFAYLMDTHTAVAFSALNDYRASVSDESKTIVASTASPYKFANDVYTSIFGELEADDLTIFELLSSKTNTPIPVPLRNIKSKRINFTSITTSEKMFDEVKDFVNK